jgi:signal transduction histidine kinase
MIELNEVNNNLVLKVRDNGQGFDTEKVSKKDSFGLNLIDSLARKLKARVEVDGSNGTCFTLDIANYKLI